MLERLPIAKRCLFAAVVLTFAAVAVATPSAADGLPGVTLTLHPSAVEARAGETILVDVEARNDGLLEQSFRLVVVDWPSTWAYELQPHDLTLAAGATAHATLTVHVPQDAGGGRNVTVALQARDGSGNVTAPVPLAIHLAPAREPASDAPPARSAPLLTLSATDASAPAGETAEGRLLVRNDAPMSLSVRFALEGSPAWRPRFKDNLDVHVLQPGETRQVVVYATVPDATTAGVVHGIRATATADGGTVETTWRVTALAPRAEEPPAGDGSGDTTPDDDPAPTSATDDPPAQTLDLAPVVAAPLEVPTGGTGRGALLLSNPTDAPLAVTLTGQAADGWPVTFEDPAPTLGPGATRELWFAVVAPDGVPPGGTGSGVVTLTTADGRAHAAPFQIRVVEAPEPAPASRPGPARAQESEPALPIAPAGLAAAVGLGAVGAGAWAFTRRPWREKLLWGAVGLYTRLLKPDVLGHEERERLYHVVQEQPGIHFHALQRELGWNTGTLTYHLRVLERHQFVVSRRDGQLRRFYLVGQAPRQETFDGPSGLRGDVLEAVRTQPGISQSDLTVALSANKQTVNYHVKALERAGTIRIEKRGRDTFLYPADLVAVASETAEA